MSNTEWKQGYDAGFAAGWKAAKKENVGLPTGLSVTSLTPFTTMADQSYSVNTTVDYGTVTLNENKKPDLRIV